MNFQENLIKLRKGHKYTARSFAKKLGIPYTTYLAYEKTDREPKYDLLIKIANIFNVSLDDLLGRTPKNEIERLEKYLSDALKEQYEEDINLSLVDISLENINFKAKIKNEEFNFSMPTKFFAKGFHNVDKYYFYVMQGDIKNYLYYYATQKFILTAKDRLKPKDYNKFFEYINDLIEFQSQFRQADGEAILEFGNE